MLSEFSPLRCVPGRRAGSHSGNSGLNLVRSHRTVFHSGCPLLCYLAEPCDIFQTRDCPCPLHWECGVLTTGLPGKSLFPLFRKMLGVQKMLTTTMWDKGNPCRVGETGWERLGHQGLSHSPGRISHHMPTSLQRQQLSIPQTIACPGPCSPGP